MLAICLLNLINIFHHISKQCSIEHGQINVTLCLTYFLNNKNYNTHSLTICFYRLCTKQSFQCISTIQKVTTETAPAVFLPKFQKLAHPYPTNFSKVNSIKPTSQLMLDSDLLKKICFSSFIESLLKMMKNAFYFILKALLVFKIFKFLS